LAVPVSFFKSISITFGGAGLIFEGWTNRGGCGHEKFCQGLPGVNPQRSNQGTVLRNLFWDLLFQKETGTASRSNIWPPTSDRGVSPGVFPHDHISRKICTEAYRDLRFEGLRFWAPSRILSLRQRRNIVKPSNLRSPPRTS